MHMANDMAKFNIDINGEPIQKLDCVKLIGVSVDSS